MQQSLIADRISQGCLIEHDDGQDAMPAVIVKRLSCSHIIAILDGKLSAEAGSFAGSK